MSSKKEIPNKLKINQVRHFSEEFKRTKVQDLEKGLTTIKDIVALYEVSSNSVYRWIYRYSIHHKQGTRQVIEMESEAKKTQALLQKIAELERVVGQKQLAIDYFEKLIEIASDELKIDLKKTLGTKILNGSTTI